MVDTVEGDPYVNLLVGMMAQAMRDLMTADCTISDQISAAEFITRMIGGDDEADESTGAEVSAMGSAAGTAPKRRPSVRRSNQTA